MLELIISLGISLIIGWFFLQWQSLSKKEKVVSLIKKLTDRDVKIEKLNDLVSVNTEITTATSGIQQNTKNEKEIEKLAVAKELKELVETIKKEGDLDSKDYDYMNMGISAGAVLISWLILASIFKKFAGLNSNQG